ncbi:hypothetical protein DP939_28215 [Spongiactinospora rosea]|uniref:Uncharacterized protein n=1 Tax=Spongiactinospora rosea TaxID=2248750 RepID=A0A366LU97_9ACTN|nr:hypothetical protein [Spongiactinospora rosea]RBQ16939.1 hypothetical protein DP939_28215 [Spongiactinospora rosea]
MTRLDAIVRRFPLIPRPRPRCGPIEERIAVARKLADDATMSAPHEGLASAAQAQNLCALIASDCGLPDLARALCRQHHNAYLDARPLTARQARLALEPLVNLARIHIRAGDGLAAHALLTDLWRALNDFAPLTIDATTLSLSGLTANSADLNDVRTWLWTVLIADGPRALINAGQWQQAREHVERHRGIGHTLLDGRQIAVVAALLTHGPAAALPLIDQTQPAHSWEKAVHACLTVLCHSVASGDTTAHAATMRRRYLHLPVEPGTQLFHARLGLTVIDLLGGPQEERAIPVLTHLLEEIRHAADGYAAKEVLTGFGSDVLPSHTRQELTRIVHSSGLHQAGVPSHLKAELLHAANTGEQALRRILKLTPGGRAG